MLLKAFAKCALTVVFLLFGCPALARGPQCDSLLLRITQLAENHVRTLAQFRGGDPKEETRRKKEDEQIITNFKKGVYGPHASVAQNLLDIIENKKNDRGLIFRERALFVLKELPWNEDIGYRLDFILSELFSKIEINPLEEEDSTQKVALMDSNPVIIHANVMLIDRVLELFAAKIKNDFKSAQMFENYFIDLVHYPEKFKISAESYSFLKKRLASTILSIRPEEMPFIFKTYMVEVNVWPEIGFEITREFQEVLEQSHFSSGRIQLLNLDREAFRKLRQLYDPTKPFAISWFKYSQEMGILMGQLTDSGLLDRDEKPAFIIKNIATAIEHGEYYSQKDIYTMLAMVESVHQSKSVKSEDIKSVVTAIQAIYHLTSGLKPFDEKEEFSLDNESPNHLYLILGSLLYNLHAALEKKYFGPIFLPPWFSILRHDRTYGIRVNQGAQEVYDLLRGREKQNSN